jgi:hypothetical protein
MRCSFSGASEFLGVVMVGCDGEGDAQMRDDLLFIRLPSSAGFQAIACQEQTDLAHVRNIIGRATSAPPKSSLGRSPFVTLTSFDLQLTRIPDRKTENSTLKIDFTSWD